jgi:hypothetical protein
MVAEVAVRVDLEPVLVFLLPLELLTRLLLGLEALVKQAQPTEVLEVIRYLAQSLLMAVVEAVVLVQTQMVKMVVQAVAGQLQPVQAPEELGIPHLQAQAKVIMAVITLQSRTMVLAVVEALVRPEQMEQPLHLAVVAPVLHL